MAPADEGERMKGPVNAVLAVAGKWAGLAGMILHRAGGGYRLDSSGLGQL
jgi:hypothetical protein